MKIQRLVAPTRVLLVLKPFYFECIADFEIFFFSHEKKLNFYIVLSKELEVVATLAPILTGQQLDRVE